MTSAAQIWTALPTPGRGSLTTEQVSASNGIEISWGIDHQRTPLLMIELLRTESSAIRRPTLTGLRIDLSPAGNGKHVVIIALSDMERQDIFAVLCGDIITAAHNASGGEDAVQRIMRRIWNWQRLLAGKNALQLSLQEQAGLFAELHTLEHVLFPVFGEERSLLAWVGPSAGVQDFDLGPLRIECKALSGAQRRVLQISSAEQLSWDTCENLLLRTVDLVKHPEGESDARTVYRYAHDLMKHLQTRVPSLAGTFEDQLAKAGLFLDVTATDSGDHGLIHWSAGETRSYHVREGFPCILKSSLSSAIPTVAYTIDRHACSPFELDRKALHDILKEYA